MAVQIIQRLIDDLDGTEAAESVRFALDGIEYTIDLSDRNAAKLRKIFTPYVDHGQKQGRTRIPTARRPIEDTAAGRDEIRTWARDTHEFGDIAYRGRIPRDVVAAFRLANPSRRYA